MLHFLDPVMFEQTLELRIELLIVFDAIEIVTLHPSLDVQRGNRHAQRIVGQYRCGNLRWSNGLRAKAVLEFLFEALE